MIARPTLHILMILLAWPFFAQSQTTNHGQILKEALKVKPRLAFGLNNRFSLVSGQTVRIQGIYAGIDFDKKLRIILGYNFLKSPVVYTRVNQGVGTTYAVDLKFIHLMADYAIKEVDKWQFNLPVAIGVGSSTQTHLTQVDYFNVFTFEFGAVATYNVLPWLGIKAGVGERLCFGQNFAQLSGPYFSLGLGFYFPEIKRMIEERI
ncbi:MAG: hypothetical protein ACI8ZN_001401 [Bacteroidia bacterium]|jgi:hypothetical protein